MLISLIEKLFTKNKKARPLERYRAEGLEAGPEEKKSGCGCAPFQPTHEGYCWSEEFPGESKGHNSCRSSFHSAIDEGIKEIRK